MKKQILAAFTILLFALAITGYAYSHWQKTINIQGTAQIAQFEILIQNHNTTLDWQMSEDNHTLTLNGTITTNQPILTEITIKNNGTTPTAITHEISTNNTDLWNTHFIYNQNITEPYELPAGNIVTILQNITLSGKPEPFTIEITATYTATFQSWTDTVSVTYTLTYQGEP